MIRYEQFTKRFGAVTAVEYLDLVLEEGETVALIGPNGSGKTTTLKAALGLIRPTSGRVLVDGRDASRDGRDARAGIGYLPQRLTFPDGMTAREVLRFYASLRRVEPELRLLDRVNLLEVADREVNGFSGGMRQRLGIAVALLGAPRVLVLDEPTASLDPSGALTLRDMIHAIRAEGTAVLLSSHDLAEVAALADRIGVFVGGRLGALGTATELAHSLGLAVSTIVSTAAGLESIYRRIAVAHPQLVA